MNELKELYIRVPKLLVKPHRRMGYDIESGVGFYARTSSLFIYAGPILCSFNLSLSKKHEWKYEGMKYVDDRDNRDIQKNH
jgi:hypothetical protein